MSVTFYCTAWAFADTSESLDKITSEELVELAVKPRSPDEYEKEPWLLEARRERAGEITLKSPSMLILAASGSRGHCLHVKQLAALHKDVIFISISGADCTEMETVSLYKDGVLVHCCEGNLSGKRLPAALKVHHYYLDGKELCDMIEDEYFKLVQELTNEGAEDAILQNDPEEQ